MTSRLSDHVTICREIRKVRGGYIAELRYPYGGNPSGYGEVIYRTWGELLDGLSKAADEIDEVLDEGS